MSRSSIVAAGGGVEGAAAGEDVDAAPGQEVKAEQYDDIGDRRSHFRLGSSTATLTARAPRSSPPKRPRNTRNPEDDPTNQRFKSS